MAKITVAICCFATALVGAPAQESDYRAPEQKPDVTITTEWTSEETTDWGYDRQSSRSRIGVAGNVKLPGKTKVLRSTSHISQLIDIKTQKPKTFCESDIDLEYFQKDEETEVRTLFTSQNCDEYDATYQLRISYFDANKKLRRIQFDERWPVGRTEQLRQTFPMEPDSELKRVTSHIISCTCRESR